MNKTGRKRVLTDEERARRKKEYQRKYYLEHQEQHREAARKSNAKFRREKPLLYAETQLRHWTNVVDRLRKEQTTSAEAGKEVH